MFSKNNSALFGVLLIIIGIYIFISPVQPSLGNMSWLMFGLALLLLYYNKRKTIALVCGVFITGLAVSSILDSTGLHAVKQAYMLFFYIPGTIFMTLFLTKNKQGLLVPASLLLWTGFGLTLKSLLGTDRASVLIICVGMALITVYLLGSLRNAKNYLYSGIVLSAMGAYLIFKRGVFDFGKAGWVLVVALCIIIFLKARVNKGTSDGDDF